MRHYETALVTGASRGLGAAIASELARRGYGVVIAARSEGELHRAAAELQVRHAARIDWLTVDLAKPDAAAGFADTVSQRFGPIDVLINNAGIGAYKPLVDWTPREVIDSVNVNLLAPMLLARALLPSMIARRKGMIVNVASDLARRHLANMAPYVAGKFGLLGFSGSLLREVKSHGVKVTSVLPGIIDTAFNEGLAGSKDETWALRPALLAERIAELLELPAHVVIDELTIHPMQQDF
jgi:short-subunit dehydrogenase